MAQTAHIVARIIIISVQIYIHRVYIDMEQGAYKETRLKNAMNMEFLIYATINILDSTKINARCIFFPSIYSY